MFNDYRNHNLLPGYTVKDGSKIGRVSERGATRDRYYVTVKWANGCETVYTNQDILKLRKY